MAFEWIRFLEQNRIDYQSSGPNVSRNHIAIHCPFCGTDDPSMHMSIHLGGKGWRCWRHSGHKGKSPARLVQSLLGISFERAKTLVGEAIFVPDDFMSQVQAHMSPPQAPSHKAIKLPKEFKPFALGMPSERPYRNYLLSRGFTSANLENITKRYGVRYCTSGPFSGRVVFVVRMEGEIVSWTGRTISQTQELRYKALSPDPERAERDRVPVAHGAISHYLLWYDRIRDADADTLILCEGPIDALKVDLLGAKYGICATCFFTAAPTKQQIELLHEICPQFKRRILLLDRGTLALGISITADLSSLDIKLEQVPQGLKDPGEFNHQTFANFALAI